MKRLDREVARWLGLEAENLRPQQTDGQDTQGSGDELQIEPVKHKQLEIVRQRIASLVPNTNVAAVDESLQPKVETAQVYDLGQASIGRLQARLDVDQASSLAVLADSH